MFKNNNNKKEELSLLTDQIKVKMLQAKYETFFHGVLERIMSIQEVIPVVKISCIGPSC